MLSEEVNIVTTTSAAKHWRRARLFIGILMGFETAYIFFLCTGIAMLALFLGSMSFIVTGSTKTEAQLEAGWRSIFGGALIPFLWPLLLGLCTLNLLMRKRAWLIIIGCVVSIVIELWLLLAMHSNDTPPDPEGLGTSRGWTNVIVVFILIQVGGIVVALGMRKREVE